MKKTLLCLIALFLLCLLCMTACSDIYAEETITDPSRYAEIWDISGRHVFPTDEDHDGSSYYCDPLKTFPRDLSSLNVTEFYCWYATYRYTGTGFQIHVAVQYDEEEYAQEMDRLANIKDVRTIRQETEKLSAPAYIAAWNSYNSYEYALCHEDSLTVDYIYLQLVSKKHIHLDSSLLSKDFKGTSEESKDEPFSIYDR